VVVFVFCAWGGGGGPGNRVGTSPRADVSGMATRVHLEVAICSDRFTIMTRITCGMFAM
jgi:hypothetical protein